MNFIDNPLTALAIWALATMALAPLPLRYQILPGVALLLVLPVLLVWVGLTYGVWLVLIGLAAAVSLFRKPLGVLWRRLMRGLR
ncbi:DUF2484 family protein [Celeribacter halophilus]|uniref:DUF2484 family protein n=1 Tax=Celeribacter halophilus TaxID=576117 RepID=A0AAW7XWH7_9RHOB|nr:DUF2484 family protein [Celeribacter halophilus]MDO6458654.1 DUF2484 family protein [Celeribacter halophilus]MDO6725084.1 DUF2484 family protein [Celeribacter halophilus]